ncbi:hypothetical protein VU07_03215 [Desulfobulbus sp. F4]|nr:hypothetical protein [Desulfobulbus sp. F4]
MKKTIQIASGLILACLSGTAAWAGGPIGGSSGPAPGGMGIGTAGMTPGDMGMISPPGVIGTAPGMSGGDFTMPVNPGTLANSYAGAGSYSNTTPISGGGMGMMPMIDLRQVVWQGMRSLQPTQRDQLAMGMANQNMQGMGNGTSPFNQIRNSVRDSIMMNRVSDISRLGQSTFRPMIQPGAVQSMISQIQPWNFPARFQSGMMPMMIPVVSQPIKQQQMAYMQQGIMNNPNFPNVPLPMPAFSPYGGSGYGGGYTSPPGGMGMYNGYGGMPPGGGGMSGYMMPSGGMGMMGGGYGMSGGSGMGGYMMMPSGGMGMMGGGGYGYPMYGY